MQSAIASGVEGASSPVDRVPCSTPESRHWGLRELARRAGVTPDQFARWQVEFFPDSTVVWVDRVAGKKIRIASHGREILQRPFASLVTNHASWMFPPDGLAAELVAALVVPYCPSRVAGKPVFQVVDRGTVESEFDLLAATVLCLSRYEEMVAVARDNHRRFRGKSSVAARDGFLDRPIIDEYGLALAQAIEFLLPHWKPSRAPAAVKLSHDIDDVDVGFSGRPRNLEWRPTSWVRLGWMALPLSLRSAIQQTTREKKPLLSAASLFQTALGQRPNARDQVRKLYQLSLQYQVDSAFYWKASHLTPFDSGYDPRSRGVKELIEEVSAHGFENGVHPGYYTFENLPELRHEINKLREAIGVYDVGGRQHYLRWSTTTWSDWEQCDLAYDSSLGYADVCGFRAGTCVPYKPWLVRENREARVLEIPLIIMESTLAQTLIDAEGEATPESMARVVQSLLRRCDAVGGVFTLLFHNAALYSPGLARFYELTLETLSGKTKYDWPAARREFWSSENWKLAG